MVRLDACRTPQAHDAGDPERGGRAALVAALASLCVWLRLQPVWVCVVCRVRR